MFASSYRKFMSMSLRDFGWRCDSSRSFFFFFFSASTAAVTTAATCIFWNFSTRPKVSTNFISPVKNGWHLAQISTLSFGLVAPTVNEFPHAQFTIQSSYHWGCILAFIVIKLYHRAHYGVEPGSTRSAK